MKSRTSDESRAELYNYSVGWSEEDRAFIARVAEFPSLAAHGRTQAAALKQMRSVVASVCADLHDTGESIPEPFGRRTFSGQFRVRIPPSKHRELALEAAKHNLSLNTLINLKLNAD